MIVPIKKEYSSNHTSKTFKNPDTKYPDFKKPAILLYDSSKNDPMFESLLNLKG